ncbi:MAG: protein translocase subunit SecF [Candidatus Liptonbacteria bacterium]|nr:protein translocase subunit SecF [Candidatus Liptonbacteria bacterium]
MINLKVIDRRKIYLTASGLLVGLGVAAIVFFGFKEGIDFTGGTLWQFRLGAEVKTEQVEQAFKDDLKVTDLRLTQDQASGIFFARLKDMSEADHQSFTASLKAKFEKFEEMSFSSIGPSVGADLRQKAIMAMIFVLLGISFYVAFAFRKVYQPISSWKYGVVTLLSLFHDVAIPAGLMAVLGYLMHVEIDTNFMVALLVVMGFSVHDTIVVFDRIRENLLLYRTKKEFGEIINESVNQTVARSINTSLTLILVLLALVILGPANLQYFVLTLLVGVTTGIYSSIFVAAPLLYVWHKLSKKS